MPCSDESLPAHDAGVARRDDGQRFKTQADAQDGEGVSMVIGQLCQAHHLGRRVKEGVARPQRRTASRYEEAVDDLEPAWDATGLADAATWSFATSGMRAFVCCLQWGIF